MNMSPKPLMALSWPFGLSFLVIWNALMWYSRWLNGGPGVYHNPTALAVAGATCLLGSAVWFGVVLSPTVRRLATAKHRQHYYEPDLFVFVGGVSAAIGVAAIYSAFTWQ